MTRHSESRRKPRTATPNYQNSRRLARTARTIDFFSLHLSLASACFWSRARIRAFRCVFFKAAMPATNDSVHPNIFASFPRLYFLGSESLRRRISATSSSDARGGWILFADGRMKGGRGPRIGEGFRRRSGELGAVDREKGEGAVGGGRCMKVTSWSFNEVTVAFGLLMSGSGAWYAGLSEVPGFGRGYRVAYDRVKDNEQKSCLLKFIAKGRKDHASRKSEISLFTVKCSHGWHAHLHKYSRNTRACYNFWSLGYPLKPSLRVGISSSPNSFFLKSQTFIPGHLSRVSIPAKL